MLDDIPKNTNNTLFENLNENKKVDENRVWLTTPQAANYLGITPNALRILVHRAKVQAYKLGRRLRFKTEDLDALLVKKED